MDDQSFSKFQTRLEQARKEAFFQNNERAKTSGEVRGILDKYYRHLSILAGSTLVLSLTLVSVFRTPPNGLPYADYLMFSWAFLFATFLTATFALRIHAWHISFQAGVFSNEAEIRSREIAMEGISELVKDLSPEEANSLSAKQKAEHQMAIFKKALHINKKMANRYQWGFKFCESWASVCFFFGILTLLIFSVLNLKAINP